MFTSNLESSSSRPTDGLGHSKTNHPKTNDPKTASFVSSSNLLARALHAAIIGEGPIPADRKIRCDFDTALKLLSISTPEEVAKAQDVMLDELGYNLTTLLSFLNDAERATLEQLLGEKRAACKASPPIDGQEFRRDFILQELERANIFPGTSIPRELSSKFAPPTLAEKLEILQEYLGFVREAAVAYPRIFSRFDELKLGEDQPNCPLSICRSIRDGAWLKFAGLEPGRAFKVRDVVSQAQPKIEEATRTVLSYQVSLMSVNRESIDALMKNLKVANQLAYDYAQDMAAYAILNLSQQPAPGFVGRLFNTKPIAAYDKAWGAIFTRYFLVKRAAGVGQFVEHMHRALNYN